MTGVSGAVATLVECEDVLYAPEHRGETAVAPFKFTSRSVGTFAMIVPFRFRKLHRWYARYAGRFWIPCPVPHCEVEFGGHEWADADPHGSRTAWGSLPATMPLPCTEGTGPPLAAAICPPCARAGVGRRLWFPNDDHQRPDPFEEVDDPERNPHG